MIYIYALVDPRSNEPRYVGWTINPLRRLHEHIQRSVRKEDTYKARWIRSLLKAELEPMMLLLEWSDNEEIKNHESEWIAHFSYIGFKLTNATEGGDGILGYHHTPESIKKFSSKLRNVPKSLEHRLRLSISRTGQKLSSATKAKMSQVRTGKKRTPESIAKTTAFHRGRKRSEETKQKLRDAWVLRKKRMSEQRERSGTAEW